MTKEQAQEAVKKLSTQHPSLEFYARELFDIYYISVHGVTNNKFIALSSLIDVKMFNIKMFYNNFIK